MITLRQCAFVIAIACGSVMSAASASAHPHVWITMKSEVIYSPDGSVKALRHAWQFDDIFSVFVTQGLKSKKKGEFTREELAPLAQLNIESLKEFEYFTVAKANGKKVTFAQPVDYYFDYDPKAAVLTLHFTLPFEMPAPAREFRVEVYDQTWYIDFGFVKNSPVRLVGAPAACKASVAGRAQMDSAMMLRLSQLPADAQLDPSMFLGTQFASKVTVKCR
jgi:ABC-type uncharacterized transport system substrate-binding protein